MDRAVGLAATILKEHDTEMDTLTLVPSTGGVFDISRDGNLIFSKKLSGRFPEPDEILKELG
jgi:selenoprotein W-related protein